MKRYRVELSVEYAVEAKDREDAAQAAACLLLTDLASGGVPIEVTVEEEPPPNGE